MNSAANNSATTTRRLDTATNGLGVEVFLGVIEWLDASGRELRHDERFDTLAQAEAWLAAA